MEGDGSSQLVKVYVLFLAIYAEIVSFRTAVSLCKHILTDQLDSFHTFVNKRGGRLRCYPLTVSIKYQ